MNSAERKQARYSRRVESREAKRREKSLRHDDFSRIIDPNNLANAFRKSRLNVSWKESVQRYEARWLLNIKQTVRKLIDGERVSGGFVEFDIHERGKTRHIKSIHISERIIQKALCDEVLVPILSRSLIYDNAASLKDKGVHFALRRLKRHLARFYRTNGNSNKGYVLSLDISKYFDSIRHDILLDKVKRYIHDPLVLKLLRDFISVFGGGISLGLGSQISQICAVFYPSDIDHFVKEKLRIKYYGRYMDDIYLIHESKSYLKHCLCEITKRLEKIALRVNAKKTRITSLGQGLLFLKGRYSLGENGKIVCLPCRASTIRMIRRLRGMKRFMDHGGKITYRDIHDSYKSWRNTFRRRFHAYHRVRKMDGFYNRLFINKR
ncbi:MAG: RNA-directed DNA polymerase [Treponema sp.]|jgi:hypothetical protein|nr:RNA-directed DNA polymerase [Treponema sp.]